jgi:Icc-related predicted phosphoesterase
MSIKLDCISDLHLFFGPKLEGGDILVVAGDISYIGKMEDFIRFNSWLDQYKKKYSFIVFTPGNHDLGSQGNPDLFKSLVPNVTHYLINEPAEILGLKFFVSPITPTFMDWAWMADRGEAIKRYWDMIPENTDVLVTHGPPYGILDQCPDWQDHTKSVSVGCEELLKAVQRIKPRVHIFGHIHEGYGQITIDKTTFINAAIMDGQYNPVNDPISIILK